MNVMAKVVFPGETGARHETCDGAVSWKFQMPIPIGWRVALGSFVVIVLLMGINLYAVLQLREVTTLSIELVSQRYPAIESAKWLLTNLYAQLASERKYLAVRDPWFLMEFRDEAEEFTQTLTVLQDHESSPEGRALLGEAEQLYAEYRAHFRTSLNQRGGLAPKETAHYEKKRDAVVTRVAQRLQAYVGLQERRVSRGVHDVSSRSAQAHTLTQLTITAILLALGAAGIAGFSLLRRRQDPVAQAGHGSVETAADGAAPATLREANTMSTVLIPRTWRQLRQAAPQIWKGAP